MAPLGLLVYFVSCFWGFVLGFVVFFFFGVFVCCLFLPLVLGLPRTCLGLELQHTLHDV